MAFGAILLSLTCAASAFEKSDNFNEASEIILLNGFLKRTNKDYKKAVNIADGLVKKYNL